MTAAYEGASEVRYFDLIRSMPQPVIAMVDGYAIGLSNILQPNRPVAARLWRCRRPLHLCWTDKKFESPFRVPHTSCQPGSTPRSPSGGLRGGPRCELESLSFFFEPITLSSDVDNARMMQQPI
jgi:hypothetical protein